MRPIRNFFVDASVGGRVWKRAASIQQWLTLAQSKRGMVFMLSSTVVVALPDSNHLFMT